MKSLIASFFSRVVALCLIMGCVTACSNEEIRMELEETPEGVTEVIYNDFYSTFPNATDAVWTVDGNYAIVTFTASASRTTDQPRTSVWYQLKDSRKAMHCMPVLFTELPEAVQSAFNESEYAAWNSEPEVKQIHRYIGDNVETIYEINVMSNTSDNRTKARLYYTDGGILVKITTETVYGDHHNGDDEDYTDWLPQTPADNVRSFIETNYPGARYLYIYEGANMTKVKILVNRTAHLLYFDVTGAWEYTKTEIDHHKLPTVITTALSASEYAGYEVEDVFEYNTASAGHYYVIEVKNHKDHLELRISDEGIISLNTSEPGSSNTPDSSDQTDTPNQNGYMNETEVKEFIAERYPDASVLKYDRDDNELEVKLDYNGIEIKIEFERYASGYVWVESEWDFGRTTTFAPDGVQATLASETYAFYRLEYLKYCEKATEANYYEAGLKLQKSEIKVKMDENGNVIAEYRK